MAGKGTLQSLNLRLLSRTDPALTGDMLGGGKTLPTSSCRPHPAPLWHPGSAAVMSTRQVQCSQEEPPWGILHRKGPPGMTELLGWLALGWILGTMWRGKGGMGPSVLHAELVLQLFPASLEGIFLK